MESWPIVQANFVVEMTATAPVSPEKKRAEKNKWDSAEDANLKELFETHRNKPNTWTLIGSQMKFKRTGKQVNVTASSLLLLQQ